MCVRKKDKKIKLWDYAQNSEGWLDDPLKTAHNEFVTSFQMNSSRCRAAMEGNYWVHGFKMQAWRK